MLCNCSCSCFIFYTFSAVIHSNVLVVVGMRMHFGKHTFRIFGCTSCGAFRVAPFFSLHICTENEEWGTQKDKREPWRRSESDLWLYEILSLFEILFQTSPKTLIILRYSLAAKLVYFAQSINPKNYCMSNAKLQNLCHIDFCFSL